MHWFSIGLGGVCGAVLSGFLVWAAMETKEKIVVAGARYAERVEQISQCNVRVDTIQTAHNDSVAKAVAEALAAAEKITDPVTEAEKRALCKQSYSCLSRGKL